jgi:hypothetical protein
MAIESKIMPIFPHKLNVKAVSGNIHSILLGSKLAVNGVSTGDLATWATLLPKINNIAVETDAVHPLRLAHETVLCEFDLTDKPKKIEYHGGQTGSAGDSGNTIKMKTHDMAWLDFINDVLTGKIRTVYGWALSDEYIFGKPDKSALVFSVSIESFKSGGKDGTFEAEIHFTFKGVYKFFDAPTGFVDYEMAA